MEKIKELLVLYFNELASLTIDMAPYILLGFLFAGILHVFIKPNAFRKYFGQNNFRSVVNAALFGIPLPLCSCGVIPTGISLKNHGASSGATVSFLTSTPQTGIDSILISGSLIGWPFAILRVLVAFFSAIINGFVTNIFNKKEKAPIINQEETSAKNNKNWLTLISNGFFYAFIELLQDIANWLLIGLFLAAGISILIPDNFFVQNISNQYLEMLIILIVSIPIYICATGSVPIAASLLLKGLSPGAALILLMAGPVTNVASLTVLGKVLGRKNLIIYLSSIIVCAFVFGTLINTFFDKELLTSSIELHSAHFHHSDNYSWFSLICAFIFSLLIVNALFLKFRIIKFRSKSNLSKINISENMDTKVFKVEGMTCSHCKANVEKNLMETEGIKSAQADIINNTVEIVGEADADKIEAIINKLGYKFIR